MFKTWSCLLYLIVLVPNILAKQESYNGYNVYRVRLKTLSQREHFREIVNDSIDFLFKPSQWNNYTGLAIISPTDQKWFEKKLGKLGIDIDIRYNNIDELFSKTNVSRKTKSEAFEFNAFSRYDEIFQIIQSTEESLANSTSIQFKVVQYGTSDQNRKLFYINVSNRDTNTKKPAIIVEAGINPREWISIAAAMYIVKKLIEDDQSYLLQSFEWIIIPVVNPDGYEYTHTSDRLWTKSMSIKSNLGLICPGVNINRNFEIDWLNSDSSTSPCSHVYAGRKAFSEVETQMIKHLIETYGKRAKAYFSLHHGKYLSYPWHYENAASGMFRQHYLLGLQMIQDMTGNVLLNSGSIALGDRCSGTSTDYAHENGVLYSYNIGIGGDLFVAENDIAGAAEDCWKAIIVAAKSLS